MFCQSKHWQVASIIYMKFASLLIPTLQNWHRSHISGKVCCPLGKFGFPTHRNKSATLSSKMHVLEEFLWEGALKPDISVLVYRCLPRTGPHLGQKKGDNFIRNSPGLDWVRNPSPWGWTRCCLVSDHIYLCMEFVWKQVFGWWDHVKLGQTRSNKSSGLANMPPIQSSCEKDLNWCDQSMLGSPIRGWGSS